MENIAPVLNQGDDATIEISKALTKFEGMLSSVSNKIIEKADKKLDDILNALENDIPESFKSVLSGLGFSEANEQDEGTDGLFGTGTIFRGALTKNKIKEIDPGSVYVADALKGLGGGDEKTDSKGSGGGIGGAIGGALSSVLGLKALSAGLPKLGGVLLKASPFLAIAAGVSMAVMDGIKGAALAEEWGVSKTAGFAGAFLAGTGEGWGNAFKNAGKWGLIGAGTGFLIGGPVGAIVGGILGAAIGGILGYFGGEKVAGFVQKIGDSLMELEFFQDLVAFVKTFGESIWNLITAPFRGMIDGILSANRIKEIWGDDEKSFGERIGAILANISEMALAGILGFITGMATGIRDFLLDFFVGTKNEEGERVEKSLLKQLVGLLLTAAENIFGFFRGLFTGMFDGLRGRAERILDAGAILMTVGTEIGNIIKYGFQEVSAGASIAMKWITDNIISPIGDFFANVYKGFSEYVSGAINRARTWMKDNITGPIGDFFSRVAGDVRAGWDIVSGWVNDNIIQPIKSLFSGMLSIFSDIGLWLTEQSARLMFSVKTSDVQKGIERLRKLGLDSGQISELASSVREEQGLMTDAGALKEISRMNKDELEGITSDIQDAIITKDGQIIRTHEDDNIVASKNDITMVSKATDTSTARDVEELNGLVKQQKTQTEMIITELKKLGEKLNQQPANIASVQNNNFATRFSPISVMRNLTTEVI